MNTVLNCLTLAAIALPGFAQTPPTPPRGHSITTRIATRRGYLGVGLGEITAERSKALKLKDEHGVEVTHVNENSPAAKAGIRENDVVLELNGQKINDSEEFARLIGESAPGAKVNMVVWRNASKQNLSATLGVQPATYYSYSTGPEGMAPMIPFPPEVLDGSVFQGLMGQSPRIGIEGETLEGQLADFFGVKEGVLVRSVIANSAAAKAGLKAGDVIVKVSGTPVSNTREISGVLRALHKTATFTVVRNRKEITLNIEIAEERHMLVPDREVL
ncbi:MAG TPA: PDZ domain-containing protein [Bryobacteraceae bacterium]|nr:PDZ domain-containing protein [Bryobacteraceae bacterium]